MSLSGYFEYLGLYYGSMTIINSFILSVRGYFLYFFQTPVLIKGLKQIFKMKSGHKYFSVTYMCIWPRAMNETIVKINKTTRPTILNNFSNRCQFYFGVLLKNGKIGPRA